MGEDCFGEDFFCCLVCLLPSLILCPVCLPFPPYRLLCALSICRGCLVLMSAVTVRRLCLFVLSTVYQHVSPSHARLVCLIMSACQFRRLCLFCLPLVFSSRSCCVSSLRPLIPRLLCLMSILHSPFYLVCLICLSTLLASPCLSVCLPAFFLCLICLPCSSHIDYRGW